MVLVSILGDFHSSVLPVFYQLRNKISKHIILYDDFKCDVKEAYNMIDGLNAFKQKYHLSFEQISHKIDEDSQKSVLLTMAFFHQHCKDFSELYVNATDGLASFNILLASKILPLEAKILAYDRFDNECNIVTKDGMENFNVDDIVSIEDHFLLKNLKIHEKGDKGFAFKHKDAIIALFEKYPQQFDDFTYHVLKVQKPSFQKFQEFKPLIESLGIKEKDLKTNQKLITGGLFEYYIFLKIAHFNYNDIEIGMIINQYYSSENFIPNEFDILIMTNNHLHMIECKYFARVNLNQLVYKYMALKHLIDDDGKIIMVTAYDEFMPNLNDDNPLLNLAHKRAKENKMLLLGDPLQNINRFVEEVRNFCEL